MKILKITILNLHSLRLWKVIDFTAPPLSDAGLFAITGDTGAGKTTVLDAITLALYGRIHRNKDVGEVMSYGATESLAEVEFAAKDGLYRARWTLRRARKQPDGKLQPPEREVSRWNPQRQAFEIIAQKIREADEAVEAASGLDYDRFCRSVLLSQGDFAAFLKAGERERSELLERITGAEIYSRLSKAAFERHKIELERLNDLRRQLETLQPLDANAIQRLEAELQQNQTDAEQLKTHLESLQNKLRALHRRRQLESDIAELDAQAQNLEAEQQTLSERQAQLFGALQQLKSEWSNIQPLLAQVIALDAAIHEKARLVAGKQQENLVLQKKREQFQQELAALEQKIEQHEQELQELQEWLQNNNYLARLPGDLAAIAYPLEELHANERERQKLLADAEKLARQWQDAKGQMSHWEKEKALAQATLETLQVDFQKKAPPEYIQDRRELLNVLSKETEQLSQQRHNLQQLAELVSVYDRLLAELTEYEEQLESLQNEQLVIDNQVMSSLEALQAAKERLEFKQNIHEQQLLIAKYEKDRHELVEGTPCPLCFSTHHPFREHPLKPFVNEAKAEFETARQVYEQIFKNHRLELQRQNEIARQIEQLKGNEIKGVGGQVEKQFKKILEYEDKIARIAPELSQEQYPFMRSHLLQHKIEEISLREHDLRQRSSALNALLRDLEQAEQHLQALEKRGNELDKNRLLLSEKQATNAKAQHQMHEKSNVIAAQLEKIFRRYGFPFMVESAQQTFKTLTQLAEDFQNRSQQLNEVSRQIELAHKDRQNILRQIADLTEQQQQQQQATDEQQRQLEALRQERAMLFGVKDPQAEQQRLQQLLEAQEQAVNDNKSALDANVQSLANLHHLRADRAAELDQLLPVAAAEDALNAQLAEGEQQYRALLERIGEIRRELQQSAVVQQQATDLARWIAVQQREYSRWAKLKDIIGSADGKTFRVFAQGLTLRKLTSLANRYLRQLHDGRYRIEKRSDQDLELDIIDTYQADNRRSMHTLSGGESFLVSLALALGLSDLAGGDTNIRSLFIDEGFGTLDANSLDLAISTLENLQAGGKTIGIISHVKELQERITTQIHIRKMGNGFSQIEIW